jgi:hypothetical protein
MRRLHRIAWLVVLPTVLGCAHTAPPEGSVTVDETRIDLTVERCSLSNGTFREHLPDDATETLLRAHGETADGQPVEVTARRSRSMSAPHTVQTVEITVGDPTGDLEALVLYRGYDKDRDRWVEIRADDPSGRVEVAGPLMRFDGPRLHASGTVVRPDGGQRIRASLRISCPVEGTDPQVIAAVAPDGRPYAAAAPTSSSAAFHAS